MRRVVSPGSKSWLEDERSVGIMKTNLMALMVVGSALVLGGCDDKKADMPAAKPADPGARMERGSPLGRED